MKKIKISRIFSAVVVSAFAFCLMCTSSVSAEGAVAVAAEGGYTFGCGIVEYDLTVDETALYAVTACEYVAEGCEGCNLKITSKDKNLNYVTKAEDGFVELITLKPGDYVFTATGQGAWNGMCIDIEKCSVPESDIDPLAPGGLGILVPLTDETKTFDITVDAGSSLVVQSFSNSGYLYEVHCSSGKKAEVYMNNTAFEDGNALHYPISGKTTFSFGFLPLKENANGAVLIYVQE